MEGGGGGGHRDPPEQGWYPWEQGADGADPMEQGDVPGPVGPGKFWRLLMHFRLSESAFWVVKGAKNM